MNPEFFRNMSQSQFADWVEKASDEDREQAFMVILTKISELTVALLEEVEDCIQDEDQDFTEANAVINRIKAM